LRLLGDCGRGFRDRVGGLGRHDAEPRLCPGQRRLDLSAAREKGLFAEHLAHRRGAEHVAEQARSQHADGHRGLTSST